MILSYEIPIIPDIEMYSGVKNIKEEDIKNALKCNIKWGRHNILKISNIVLNGIHPDIFESMVDKYEDVDYVDYYQFVDISHIDVDNMKIFISIDENHRLKDFFEAESKERFSKKYDIKGAYPQIYYNDILSRVTICDFEYTAYNKSVIEKVKELYENRKKYKYI